MGEEGIDFLNTLNWALMPQLIGCKNKAERISYLTKELPQVLDFVDNIKVSLSEIGQCFLFDFTTYNTDGKEIKDFMDIFNPLLQIAQMYRTYEWNLKQMQKAA